MGLLSTSFLIVIAWVANILTQYIPTLMRFFGALGMQY